MNQKILIADDDTFIRMLLEQSLEELEDAGTELLFAENGTKAMELILAEKPSLVFLDIMMPGISGLEVCSTIKKDIQLKDTFIVLLTAKGQETDRESGLESGADQFMTKPFDPDKLLQLAREVLDKNIVY
jgi:CheY-like chemotaxis protein